MSEDEEKDEDCIYTVLVISAVRWGAESPGVCERCQREQLEPRSRYQVQHDPASYAVFLAGDPLNDDTLQTWRKLSDREDTHFPERAALLPAQTVCRDCALDLLLATVGEEDSLQSWAELLLYTRPGECTASGLSLDDDHIPHRDFLAEVRKEGHAGTTEKPLTYITLSWVSIRS
jgi:hypothetical protein